jgi:hypothetical protein
MTELMRLSKIELSDLLARITNALPNYAEEWPERSNGASICAISVRCWRDGISPWRSDSGRKVDPEAGPLSERVPGGVFRLAVQWLDSLLS